MAAAAGAAFALSSVLVVPRPADQGQRAAPAVVAQVGEESAITQALPAPPNAAAATVSGPAALARAQASCEDPSTSFLSPQCQPARKSHALRAAQEKRRRLAAVPLGHGDTPASAPTPAAAEAVPHHVAPAPDKPKPVKTAHKHRRDNPDVDVVAGAPPPPPPPAFGLFGLFRDLPLF